MQSASSDAGAGGFLGALSRPKFMLFASVVSSCLFYYIYFFFFTLGTTYGWLGENFRTRLPSHRRVAL